MANLKKKLQLDSVNILGLVIKWVLIWFIFSFLVLPNVNLIFKCKRYNTRPSIHYEFLR